MNGSSVAFALQQFPGVSGALAGNLSLEHAPYLHDVALDGRGDVGEEVFNNFSQAYGEEGPLYRFKDFYVIFHGYLSLVVCVFGIIANIANIIVLTR